MWVLVTIYEGHIGSILGPYTTRLEAEQDAIKYFYTTGLPDEAIRSLLEIREVFTLPIKREV